MEPFSSDWALYSYLQSARDWSEDRKKEYPEFAFRKRFGGVWFELSGRVHSTFSGDVHISPSVGATPTWSWEDHERLWEAYREATSTFLEARGLTIQDIENEIARLLQNYKRFVEPFKQKQREQRRDILSHTAWEEHEGEEALIAWRRRVEELVLEMFKQHAESYVRIIEAGKSYGYAPKRPFISTANLFQNFIEKDTGGYELGWPSGYGRAWAGRAFSAILTALAKQKLILSGEAWGERGKWTFEEAA